MIKVGLTGGIGSGKSTVSNMLKEKNIPIIDADIISREVLDIYPGILEKIKITFGDRFIDDKGKLKRRELGDYVFRSEDLRKKLENIIIPYIKKEIFDRIDRYENIGETLCIIDAPTLIENSLHRSMDVNILVWVDEDTQINRVMNRDNLNKEQVLNRIKSQMPLEYKKGEVDFIIDNSRSLEYTKDQIERILESIRNLKEEL